MSDMEPVVRFAPGVLDGIRHASPRVIENLLAEDSPGLSDHKARWLRSVRESQDAAIMSLIERTPEDTRGILVTRTTVMSEQEMRMNTSVVRSDDVPSGTIRYQDEPARMSL